MGARFLSKFLTSAPFGLGVVSRLSPEHPALTQDAPIRGFRNLPSRLKLKVMPRGGFMMERLRVRIARASRAGSIAVLLTAMTGPAGAGQFTSAPPPMMAPTLRAPSPIITAPVPQGPSTSTTTLAPPVPRDLSTGYPTPPPRDLSTGYPKPAPRDQSVIRTTNPDDTRRGAGSVGRVGRQTDSFKPVTRCS